MADATVKAIFAGDSTSLDRTFSKVGSGAKQMASDLDSASGKAKSLGGAMSGVGDAVDASESKFMGTADVLDGFASIMGFNIDRQIELARGFGDIAGGLTNLGPLFSGVIAKVGAMVGITSAQTAATGSATAAQWSLNGALAANPIGVVVIAIAALVAGFVLAWKHSETFRDIVRGALNIVKDAAVGLWDFFKGLPDKLLSIGNTVKDAILWPYKTAFNLIAKAWNSTVGKLSFEIPSWVPGGLGGKGFSMPKLPEFHTGGVVPGVPGTEVPIMALAGERVARPAAGGGTERIQLVLDGRVVAEVVRDRLLQKQRTTPLGFAT